MTGEVGEDKQGGGQEIRKTYVYERPSPPLQSSQLPLNEPTKEQFFDDRLPDRQREKWEGPESLPGKRLRRECDEEDDPEKQAGSEANEERRVSM